MNHDKGATNAGRQKLLVFLRPATSGGDKWMVHPGVKELHPGDNVHWKAFGCKTFELRLPEEIFENVTYDNRGGSATVRRDAPHGFREYHAICDGREAEGGSAPGVIIDNA